MPSLTVSLDKIAADNINKLKKFYGTSSDAELIKKALFLLIMASEIEMTHGKLIAKKGGYESEILVRG